MIHLIHALIDPSYSPKERLFSWRGFGVVLDPNSSTSILYLLGMKVPMKSPASPALTGQAADTTLILEGGKRNDESSG